MTIILPPGKWAQRKWFIKYRLNRIYVRCRKKIDWKWYQVNHGSFYGVKREDLRRVRVRHPETGKKSWTIYGKVEFKPFRIDSTQTLTKDDALYLRINSVGGDHDE